MNIVDKRLDELTPYEKNPRRNEDAVKYVEESISRFGFKVPIVIDKNGVIVAGHTRYKAAKNLGMEEVPCVIADDLDEKQIKAFRLADNKVSEFATWDFELLNEELEELFDFDMEEFGFVGLSDMDVDSFFEDAEPKEPEPEEKEEIKCPHCGMYFTVD